MENQAPGLVNSQTKHSLAIIPARGGSKGIPGKNIKHLLGNPLLAYSAHVAATSSSFGKILLNTDSEEIATVGKSLGLEVPFLRPASLATDTASMKDVVEHTLDWAKNHGEKYEFAAILQPTSPFRAADTVRKAMELLWSNEVDSVVAVTTVPPHFSPHYVMKLDENGYLTNFLPEGKSLVRRQDAPSAYSRCGAIYAFRIKSFLEHGSIYGMRCLPLVVSEHEAVNIDTPEDWEYAEWIGEKHNLRLPI